MLGYLFLTFLGSIADDWSSPSYRRIRKARHRQWPDRSLIHNPRRLETQSKTGWIACCITQNQSDCSHGGHRRPSPAYIWATPQSAPSFLEDDKATTANPLVHRRRSVTTGQWECVVLLRQRLTGLAAVCYLHRLRCCIQHLHFVIMWQWKSRQPEPSRSVIYHEESEAVASEAISQHLLLSFVEDFSNCRQSTAFANSLSSHR